MSLRLLPGLRITSHLLLALLLTLLLTTLIRTQPTQPEVDEVRTSLLVFGGCALLGVWVVRVGEMLRGGGAGGGGRDVELELGQGRGRGWGLVSFEGLLGVGGGCWSSLLIPRLLTLPPTPTRSYLLFLLPAITLLIVTSVIGLALDRSTAAEGGIRLLADEEVGVVASSISSSEKVGSAATPESEQETELLTDSSLFLGVLMGGSLTCLLAAGWMTCHLGFDSPSALFLLPSLLTLSSVLFPHIIHPPFTNSRSRLQKVVIPLTSLAVLLSYHASMSFTLSRKGAPTCGIFSFETQPHLEPLAPLLCALSRTLYYTSWLTLAGLVFRLFGLHLAERLQDDAAFALALERESEGNEGEEGEEPWGWRDEVDEIREKVGRVWEGLLGGRE